MKKRVALLLAIVMLMVPVLAACGSNNKADNKANNTATENTDKKDEVGSVQDVNKQQETQKEETITYKKHVVVGTSGGITTIDPQLDSSGGSAKVYNLTQNSLISYDVDARELVPELAESWEVEAADSYVFHLRKGIKFSNGEELTSDDVVYTYTVRPGVVSGTTGTKIWNSIEEIEVIDDYTFRMKLVSKNIDFLHNLHPHSSVILNREACEADPAEGQYIGTGGWIVESWSINDFVHLTRNDDSWVWEENGVSPTEEITVKFIPEGAARAIALQNNEIQVAEAIAAADLEALKGAEGITLANYPLQNMIYYCVNMVSGPFANDKNLRKAVSYAINYEEIVEYMTNGLGATATTVWGATQFGYYDAFEEPIEYNVDKAKEYLAKSNMPNGGTINIWTFGSQDKIAELMQAYLKEIGIELTITCTDLASYNAAVKEKNFEMGMSNFAHRYEGDQYSYMGDTEHASNVTGWDSPEMQAMFDEAREIADDAKRLELYKQVQEIINDERVYAPMYHPVTNVGWVDGISGVQWKPDTYNDYTYVVYAE